jgi:hypothetical protein
MTLKGGLVLALPLCLLVATGCGGGNENPHAPASVTGKVTYKGEPVPAGLVNFIPKTQGPSATGSLSSDGTYSITDAPAGDFTVTVDTEYLNPDKKTQAYPGAGKAGAGATSSPMPGGGGTSSPMPGPAAVKAGGKYVKIPAKYADVKQSTLTAKLNAGKQTEDFKLED